MVIQLRRDLSFNKLTGEIPASFQHFSSLKYLYLGSNKLNGNLPSDIGTKLMALDVSFNPLTGNIPLDWSHVSINTVGTSINDVNLKNEKACGMLQCLEENTECKSKAPSTSFFVNCGGPEQSSQSGTVFDDDSEKLGAASLYTSSNNKWAVSSSGVYISNPNGPIYTAQIDSQSTNTLDSELYKTVRIAPTSLRYYGLGLANGVYKIELHFSEVVMDDNAASWKGLGRRLFNAYVQGERVLQDLDIAKEAGGSRRALVKTMEANVTKTVMDIHLMWGGKGTCCIPSQSTYGPLLSALHVSQVSALDGTGNGSDGKRVGRIVGITFGCAAALLVICGAVYLWWAKKETAVKVYTQAPKD